MKKMKKFIAFGTAASVLAASAIVASATPASSASTIGITYLESEGAVLITVKAETAGGTLANFGITVNGMTLDSTVIPESRLTLSNEGGEYSIGSASDLETAFAADDIICAFTFHIDDAETASFEIYSTDDVMTTISENSSWQAVTGGEDSGDSEDSGNSSDSEDSGNSSDSEDSGNSSDSEDSGNSGDSEDSGNSGDSEDSGNSGDSEDSGNSSDSEDSGNSNDSEDSGNSGDSEDSGNSGDSEDSGNSGDSEDSGNNSDSEDSGNSGDSEDSGNSGDSEDSGNSGDSEDSGNSGDSEDSGNNSGSEITAEEAEAAMNSAKSKAESIDKSKYTEKSLAALQAALDGAAALPDTATPAEIKAAADKILAALNGLVDISNVPTGVGFAIVPVVLAAAGVIVASKKRR